jgi:hypothetical protein
LDLVLPQVLLVMVAQAEVAEVPFLVVLELLDRQVLVVVLH